MNENHWEEILRKAAVSLIDIAKTDCGEGSSISDIKDKLSEYLYTSDQTIDMSGSRAQAKEALINYTKTVVREYI